MSRAWPCLTERPRRLLVLASNQSPVTVPCWACSGLYLSLPPYRSVPLYPPPSLSLSVSEVLRSCCCLLFISSSLSQSLSLCPVPHPTSSPTAALFINGLFRMLKHGSLSSVLPSCQADTHTDLILSESSPPDLPTMEGLPKSSLFPPLPTPTPIPNPPTCPPAGGWSHSGGVSPTRPLRQ